MTPDLDPFRADDASAAGATLHVRVFDFVPNEEASPARTSLPAWFEASVQPSYRRNFQPHALSLAPIRVSHSGDILTLERLAIAYPHLDMMEIVAFLPAAAVGTGLSEGGSVAPVDSGFQPDIELDPSAPNTLPWICDMSYLELTGRRVRVIADDDETSGPYRMDGTVAFFGGAVRVGDAAGVAHGDQRCYGRLAELAVYAPRPPRSLSEAADYVVIAGIATRARHLVGRLHRKIDRAARTIGPKAPWQGMHTSAEVQREAIAMRSELTGRAGFFLASFELQRLYKAVAPAFGVPADDLDAFDKSLQDLQGFSTSLLGLAIDRSQMRFAIYGLLFALFSLAFASVSVLDFVNAEPSEAKLWVLAALALTLTAFGATIAVFSASHGRLAALRRRG